jgi:broad specificity phosphatase PhoE
MSNDTELGLPSYTIKQFCKLENISPPTYHNLKNRGLGPREMRPTRGIVRISPEARREWHAMLERMPAEEQRQWLRERAVRIAEKSVQSPKHISKTRRTA